MSLVPCPSCGQSVSHLAEECVHCGYDLVVAPPAETTPAVPRRVRRGRLVLAGTAGAVAVVAVLGTFAAMASPRLRSLAGAASWAPDEGVAVDGEISAVEVLSMVLELQQEHFAHHGAYTANLGDPSGADYLQGWSAAMAPPGYDLSVVEADTAELCVQARPRSAAAGAPTMTIDETGALRESEGCTSEIALAPTFAES